MLAAQIRSRYAHLMLLQDPNDMVLREMCFLQRLSLINQALLQIEGISGGKVMNLPVRNQDRLEVETRRAGHLSQLVAG